MSSIVARGVEPSLGVQAFQSSLGSGQSRGLRIQSLVSAMLGSLTPTLRLYLHVVHMALQTEKNIFELIMRFIADTDTDENYSIFRADADTVDLCSFEGAA